LSAPLSTRGIPIRGPTRAPIAIDQMMMLISAAGLIRQFRFVGIVTNLQQEVAAPKGEAVARE
jgi:hypothetical protein